MCICAYTFPSKLAKWWMNHIGNIYLSSVQNSISSLFTGWSIEFPTCYNELWQSRFFWPLATALFSWTNKGVEDCLFGESHEQHTEVQVVLPCTFVFFGNNCLRYQMNRDNYSNLVTYIHIYIHIYIYMYCVSSVDFLSSEVPELRHESRAKLNTERSSESSKSYYRLNK